MNAIFAVAFFAACVAAQTFDRTTTTTDLNKLLLKSRWNTKYDQLSVADLFRSSGLYGKHFGIQNINSYDRVATPWVLPRSYYNSNVGVDTTVYTLDEIVRHPLFRQYLVLPLFRQHLSHPLFQYYLTTPLFQHYWTIPQFQTFFQNPYLFYKYVYPVVYNTESTIFDQVKTDSLYPYGRYQSTDSVVDVDRYLNNGVVNTDSLSQYLVPRHYQYPSIYGQSQQYSSVFRHHLPYTYVMDKIFKSYFINKPQITEVVTDVKVQPDNRIDEQTYGKYVDPITGEVKYTTGDYKVVDENIVPVIGDRNIDVEDIVSRRPVVDQLLGGKHFNVKDTLLKRLYLNKVLYGDRKFEELYPEYSTETQSLKDIPILDKINKLHRLENIVGKINGVDNKVDIDELIRTPVDSDILRPYLTKDLLTRVPLTKDIKDFTLSKYDLPVEFKTFDKPTTKTVIV